MADLSHERDAVILRALTRSVRLLADLPSEAIRSLARAGSVRDYSRGEVLFAEGDPAGDLYVILSGAVQIHSVTRDGQQTVLALLGAGECLGELSLLDGRPRSASATVAEAGELLAVGGDAFERWLAATPDASRAMLRVLSLRIRRSNEHLADISAFGVRQRVARRLLDLVDSRAQVLRDAETRVPITQQELAAMLGATRESVNKSLREFARLGLVKLDRGAVSLLDIAGLAQAAEL